MPMMRKRRREEPPLVDQAALARPVDLHGEIRSIAKQASTIGRESAEARGLLDETTRAFERGGVAVASLTTQVTDINRAQAGIGSVSNGGLAAVERVRVAVEGVLGVVASIITAAEQSRAICGGLDPQMTAIAAEMGQTGRAPGAAMKRSETFLDVSEHLIEHVAECGIETEDTPFIKGAIDASTQIAGLLEAAPAAGTISSAQLFDEAYRPIPKTNPAQHTTGFVALADPLFPAVQEHMLGSSPKVVFCIAVDRNGYGATHNRKYCRPQRGDLAWDSANSRYRRIFNDRTGLASARNERPFLLQTCRHDMGGGSFILMKEAAAPITVNGRHWGGVRLAFKS